jgi:nitrogen fixation NifU-like protein
LEITVSGLEDLYREIILDHYRSPRNRGELETPPAVRAEGFNPVCGDEVVLYLQVEDGVVTDVAMGGQGCSISQSSGSMMSAAIKGKTLEEVKALSVAFKSMMSIDTDADSNAEADADLPAEAGPDDEATADVKLGDLEALRGVNKFPVRIKCATLSWNTLAQALEEAESAS